MTHQTITVRYPSWERFDSDRTLLREGKISIPIAKPLPVDTRVTLRFILPHSTEPHTADGIVVAHDTGQSTPAMLVAFVKGSEKTLARLLTAQETSSAPTSPSPAVESRPTTKDTPPDCPALSAEWLAESLKHFEPAPLKKEKLEPLPPPPPARDKKELSTTELTRARLAAGFLINLTQGHVAERLLRP